MDIRKIKLAEVERKIPLWPKQGEVDVNFVYGMMLERTIHHLTPREFGGGPEDTSKLCIPCHKQIHALYPNSELAIRLNTIEKLQDDPEIKKYLNWIKKQPAGKLPRIKKSGYRRL